MTGRREWFLDYMEKHERNGGRHGVQGYCASTLDEAIECAKKHAKFAQHGRVKIFTYVTEGEDDRPQ